MLGFVPGLLHAWYIIAKYPDPESYSAVSQHDPESHNHQANRAGTTYIIVQGPDGRQQRIAKAGGNSAGGYGTVEQPNVHQGSNGSWGVGGQTGGVVNSGGEGSSNGQTAVPPTYAEAVKDDHKVQNHD